MAWCTYIHGGKVFTHIKFANLKKRKTKPKPPYVLLWKETTRAGENIQLKMLSLFSSQTNLVDNFIRCYGGEIPFLMMSSMFDKHCIFGFSFPISGCRILIYSSKQRNLEPDIYKMNWQYHLNMSNQENQISRWLEVTEEPGRQALST